MTMALAIGKKPNIFTDLKENNPKLTKVILNFKNKSSLNKSFWSYPFLTLKTIALIHLQDIKLLCKNIPYFKKTKQHNKKKLK